MIYGYCRVSTKGQKNDGNGLEAQEYSIVERYSSAAIYTEAYTGKTTDRPVFNQLVEKLKKGDTLVVAKLDRLARNTVEGIQIIKKLFEKGVAVHVLNVGLLEDTPMGQFFITTLLAVAELERNQIIERTQAGKEIARQNPDFKDGRKMIDFPENFPEYITRVENGYITATAAAKELGISRKTWYNMVKRYSA